MRLHVVVSRQVDGDESERTREDAFASRMAGLPGVHVLRVPHLYHLPEESPVWASLAALDGTLLVASWLHPRPMAWLLRRHGVGGATPLALNLAAHPTDDACAAEACRLLGLAEEGAERSAAPPDQPEPPQATAARWYPVVDQSRCTGCGHCLQFCLFGVYAPGEGRPVVAQPDRCKPGCPACSRICPEGAIMFPLYARDEAIAGAPGRLMSPDAAARRMFYTRTGRTCPECGQMSGPGPSPRPAPGVTLCSECGRPLPKANVAAPEEDPALADIDALIETLDGLAQRRS